VTAVLKNCRSYESCYQQCFIKNAVSMTVVIQKQLQQRGQQYFKIEVFTGDDSSA
jgi:hypothetical protein